MDLKKVMAGSLAVAVLMTGCAGRKQVSYGNEDATDDVFYATEESSGGNASGNSEEALLAVLGCDPGFDQMEETPVDEFEWEEDQHSDDALPSVTVTGYKGTRTSVRIPEKINGITVANVRLPKSDTIEQLGIPASVLNISGYYFDDAEGSTCPQLKEILVSRDSRNYCSIDGVLYYLNKDRIDRGEYADYVINGTLKLACVPEAREKELTIPDKTTSVKSYAFWRSHVDSVVLPESVTEIENSAFAYSENRSIEVQGTLESIPVNAFYKCGAESIVFDNSVGEIGEATFLNSAALKEIVIPEGTTEIGMQAFCDCSSLERVVIPGSVVSIGDSAFSDCISLREISIADGLKTIGSNVFYDCTSLTSITLPSTLESIGEWSFALTGISEIVLPDGLSDLDDRAFMVSDNLKVYYRGVGFNLIPDKAVPEELLDRINNQTAVENIDCNIRRVADFLVWDEYPGAKEYFLRWGDSGEDECLYNNSVNIYYRINESFSERGNDVNVSLYVVKPDDTEEYAGAFVYHVEENPYSWQDAQAAGLTTQGSYHISRVYTTLMWDRYEGGSGFYYVQGDNFKVNCFGNSCTGLMEAMEKDGSYQYGDTYSFNLYAQDSDNSLVYMDTFTFEYSYTPAM